MIEEVCYVAEPGGIDGELGVLLIVVQVKEVVDAIEVLLLPPLHLLHSDHLAHVLRHEAVGPDGTHGLHPPPPAVAGAEDAQGDGPPLLHHPVQAGRGAGALGVALNDGAPRLYLNPPPLGVGKAVPGHVGTAVPGLRVAPLPRRVALAAREGVGGSGWVWDPVPVDVGRDVGEVGRNGRLVHCVLNIYIGLGRVPLCVEPLLPIDQHSSVSVRGHPHAGGVAGGVATDGRGGPRGRLDDECQRERYYELGGSVAVVVVAGVLFVQRDLKRS